MTRAAVSSLIAIAALRAFDDQGNARTVFDAFAAVRHAAQLGHIAKNRQKRDSKNS